MTYSRRARPPTSWCSPATGATARTWRRSAPAPKANTSRCRVDDGFGASGVKRVESAMNPPVRLGPADPHRVDVGHELPWWCRHFGVTAEELRAAVNNVGTDAQAVLRELIARIEPRPKVTSGPKRSPSRIRHR